MVTLVSAFGSAKYYPCIALPPLRIFLHDCVKARPVEKSLKPSLYPLQLQTAVEPLRIGNPVLANERQYR